MKSLQGVRKIFIVIQKLSIICYLIATLLYVSLFTDASMQYTIVLSNFKQDYDIYLDLKKQDKPEIPTVNDKDFEDALSRKFGCKGPLVYVSERRNKS